MFIKDAGSSMRFKYIGENSPEPDWFDMHPTFSHIKVLWENQTLRQRKSCAHIKLCKQETCSAIYCSNLKHILAAPKWASLVIQHVHRMNHIVQGYSWSDIPVSQEHVSTKQRRLNVDYRSRNIKDAGIAMSGTYSCILPKIFNTTQIAIWKTIWCLVDVSYVELRLWWFAQHVWSVFDLINVHIVSLADVHIHSFRIQTHVKNLTR